jgi:hypothetical protein
MGFYGSINDTLRIRLVIRARRPLDGADEKRCEEYQF